MLSSHGLNETWTGTFQDRRLEIDFVSVKHSLFFRANLKGLNVSNILLRRVQEDTIKIPAAFVNISLAKRVCEPDDSLGR